MNKQDNSLLNWKKSAFFLLGALFCCAPVLWLFYTGKLQLLLNIPGATLMGGVLLIAMSQGGAGWQYFLSLRRMGCGFEKKDIFFYPYMQSLAGLLIPAQGTSLFALFYLKVYYRFQMTQSLVMILFLYLLNFLFLGVAGVAYSLFSNGNCGILFAVAILCLLVPAGVFLLCLILKRWGKLPLFPEKYTRLLLEAMDSMHKLLSDFPLLVKLLAIQLLMQGIMAMAYVLLGRQLCGHADFLWGYLIVVSQGLSLILRFTPGNLGMTEVVAGVISGITGVPVVNGITCSLVISLLKMLLSVVCGGCGIFLRLKTGSFTWGQIKKSLRNQE